MPSPDLSKVPLSLKEQLINLPDVETQFALTSNLRESAVRAVQARGVRVSSATSRVKNNPGISSSFGVRINQEKDLNEPMDDIFGVRIVVPKERLVAASRAIAEDIEDVFVWHAYTWWKGFQRPPEDGGRYELEFRSTMLKAIYREQYFAEIQLWTTQDAVMNDMSSYIYNVQKRSYINYQNPDQQALERLLYPDM